MIDMCCWDVAVLKSLFLWYNLWSFFLVYRHRLLYLSAFSILKLMIFCDLLTYLFRIDWRRNLGCLCLLRSLWGACRLITCSSELGLSIFMLRNGLDLISICILWVGLRLLSKHRLLDRISSHLWDRVYEGIFERHSEKLDLYLLAFLSGRFLFLETCIKVLLWKFLLFLWLFRRNNF